MGQRKDVLFTSSQLGRAIHGHGLPVVIEAAGSGFSVTIKDLSEVATKAREILRTAEVFGNGLVVNN